MEKVPKTLSTPHPDRRGEFPGDQENLIQLMPRMRKRMMETNRILREAPGNLSAANAACVPQKTALWGLRVQGKLLKPRNKHPLKKKSSVGSAH